ncbi:MAG: hypothetical protein GY795_22425 [Desulfobacterales bacterium]|nr:hypothetical protein [Desulfobacterales bacterium]
MRKNLISIFSILCFSMFILIPGCSEKHESSETSSNKQTEQVPIYKPQVKNKEMVKSVQNHIIELQECNKIGRTVLCNFLVTNTKEDGEFEITGASRMFDESGKRYSPYLQLGGDKGAAYARSMLKRNIPKNASLEFKYVSPNMQLIRQLDIGCNDLKTRVDFLVRYHNVLFSSPLNSSNNIKKSKRIKIFFDKLSFVESMTGTHDTDGVLKFNGTNWEKHKPLEWIRIVNKSSFVWYDVTIKNEAINNNGEKSILYYNIPKYLPNSKQKIWIIFNERVKENILTVRAKIDRPDADIEEARFKIYELPSEEKGIIPYRID